MFKMVVCFMTRIVFSLLAISISALLLGAEAYAAARSTAVADNSQFIQLAQSTTGDSETPKVNDAQSPKADEPKKVAPESEPKTEPEATTKSAEETSEKPNINDIPTPEIQRDLSKLPFPVRRMREIILEAAHSGNIEKLRPIVGSGADVTQFSLGGIDGDPIAFLKEASGDAEGHEILAILIEILDAGYVHIEVGTEHELYVWPYFFSMPLTELTPVQRVELFKIITFGDYVDMESFGAYIYYRVGITPEGRWRFFVAGD